MHFMSGGPKHDQIPSTPVLPASLVRCDIPAVDEIHMRPLWPRVRNGLLRITALATIVSIMQIIANPPSTMAAREPLPVHDETRPWFPIVLVTVNGEPLHPISGGDEEPAIFYADRASCMAATRVNVRPMHDAGIKGRFLCMYPRQPDASLNLNPREVF